MPQTSITYKGLPATILENESLRLTFLPQYACKLVSLVSKRTGREFLFQPQEETITVPTYGNSFSSSDEGGFTEVFPSLETCPYPQEPFTGTIIPDHGEIWALPWSSVFSPNGYSVQATVESTNLPYALSRTTTLQNNEIHFDYTLQNNGDFPFKYIWMPYAVLACTVHTKLLIPGNLQHIVSVSYSSLRLGAWGTAHTYPITKDIQHREMDLSQMEPPESHTCEKFYFTSTNQAGWCGIEHTDTAEQLSYMYDAEQLPYLGIWKNQGGCYGHYNLVLKPCTGVYDNLYLAHAIRRCSVVKPQSQVHWSLRMVIK